ncbi:N-acetyltransferase GCN5 [Pectobacterium araliae]|uniref:GNAT family N-acetyltransferase n=1 Tax=Pectobacterium araliae TaxID=3073862 RepID=A0AAN0K872_9GAMM|nr:GNAT family N-acetyltransferase [Pectobacterium sp. MAFF 302110]GKW19120.1 N-acetyltransferase GCN5 [Pectobacterium carotovorum subsp. carotovorum]
MSNFRLSLIDSDQDYLACFGIMHELRPHIHDAAAFVAQVRRQAGQGYRLMAAWQSDRVMAVAGYRVQENLLYGRFLYVDDLVAAVGSRRQSLGGMLIEALRNEARRKDCIHLVLDTALGNALAQRFYFRQGLLSKGLHFSQVL